MKKSVTAITSNACLIVRFAVSKIVDRLKRRPNGPPFYISIGGFFTVASPMVAEFFGTGAHGLLFGIILSSATLGGAVGPLMAGRIHDLARNLQLAFPMLSILPPIGFVLIILLRPIAARYATVKSATSNSA